mmetsp:Transcript_1854/g.7447  ORF Transcript_1854/g.7447 Transcript_1854/m.7447 type:complete len:234 (-) Transcript_1854:1724-2425(-)
MRDGMHVLRDGHARVVGQPHRGRDMRAGLARAQPLRIDRRAQRGDDGDGRAAGQLRGGSHRAEGDDAPGCLRHAPAIGNSLDGWRSGFDSETGRRRAERRPGAVSARPHAESPRDAPALRGGNLAHAGTADGVPEVPQAKIGAGRDDRVHRHRRRERLPDARARAGRARGWDAPGGRRPRRGFEPGDGRQTEKGAERVFREPHTVQPHGRRRDARLPFTRGRRPGANGRDPRR